MDRASQAVQAGNKDEAVALLETVVKGILNVSDGPKMKSDAVMKGRKRGE